MFFGFQTPTSEYAQALVDFHHYAFFFLIAVTIFVIWMIRLSLLFVTREKNLIYIDKKKTSDFFFEENNKWLRKNGEGAFLVKSLFSFIWKFISNTNVGNLFESSITLQNFFKKMIPSFFIQWFILLNSFLFYSFMISFINNNIFFNLRNGSLNFFFKAFDEKNLNFLFLNIWAFYSTQLYNIFLMDINQFNFRLNNIVELINERKYIKILNNLYLPFVNINNVNLTALISVIPFYMISTVKQGYLSIRLSHWSWSGKKKDVFLLYTGDGDAYHFPANEHYAFDENTELPQSLKFIGFYNQDMWGHSFLFFQNVRHRLVLEWVWTFIPTLILLILVIPSLYLLYSYDRPYVTAPYLTFKAIGHQWYWSYEYWDYTHSNGGSITFDSYMIHEDDLELGQLRLLEVDRRVVLPAGVCIRLLTTSTDVLHSWAMPAFGVKIDSIPGRLNQFWLVLNKPGVYYGQCSELCGVNHGFMPIAVEVVFLDQYLDFINLNCDWFESV